MINFWLMLVMLALIDPKPVKPKNKCKMTYFGGRTDKWRGGVTPCLGRRVSSSDWGIAMRNKRCGELVLLRNPRTGNTAIVPVIDRGPYGAGSHADGTWYVKLKRKQPHPTTGEIYKWRGCGDLTKPVSKALGHNGYEIIEWEIL